jgi:Protein of unknown function (DUF3987)
MLDIFSFNKKDGASAISNEALEYEIKIRERVGAFPLHVFHKDVLPFINSLVDVYDMPRSYVGTSLLTAYSTAIGTACAVYENEDLPNFFGIWSCLIGVSSAGKSLANTLIFRPIYEKQKEYDRIWNAAIEGLTAHERSLQKLKTIAFRDVHVATLMRYVMPDNPKGVLKDADEILEWINGMNQLSKKGEGTDEQFYLSSWNCRNFSAIRSGKDKYTIARPFINITGGVQPSVAPKLFANNRDTTGFIFRLLFAPPEKHKIARPNMGHEVNPDFQKIHNDSLKMMLEKLPVEDDEQIPWKWRLSPEAMAKKKQWMDETINKINDMKELGEIEIHSGIYGKIQEYINRFAGILAVADYTFWKLHDAKGSNTFGLDTREYMTSMPQVINGQQMSRALELANYYYRSAAETHRIVSLDLSVPPKIITLALMFRQGKSLAQMADFYYGSKEAKMKMKREVEKLVKKYPKTFGGNV